MAHKDQFGIWREDEFRQVAPKPKKCPECKSKDLEYDLWEDEDEIDGELMDAWEGKPLPYPYEKSDDWDRGSIGFCTNMRTMAECGECGKWIPYGDIAYWNPISGNYDLQRPLLPDEAEKAELEAERLQAIAAGQRSFLEESHEPK